MKRCSKYDWAIRTNKAYNIGIVFTKNNHVKAFAYVDRYDIFLFPTDYWIKATSTMQSKQLISK